MVNVVVSRAMTAATALLIGLPGGILLAGCAEGASPVGDVTGSGGTGVPGTGGGTAGSGAGAATFTRVWNEVLVPKSCNNAACHGAMPPMGALSMTDQATAYTNLVGVMAAGPLCQSSGKLRVKAGSPDMSLLVQKLSQATPSCGTTMPPGAAIGAACTTQTPTSCNTMAEVGLVRDWITANALNN